MQFKTGTQIIGASRVKLAVIFRKQDINIMHTIISRAKGVSSNRSAGTQKLKPKRLCRLVSQRQILEQPHDARSIGFCPLSQLWRNSHFSVSAFQRFRFLKVTEAPAENVTAGAGWGGDPPPRYAAPA